MYVALISQYFHPEQFSNNAIARELVRRGHEVHAFPCVPNYPEGRFPAGYSNTARREETWEGVRISRVLTVPRGRRALSLIANYLVYPLAASWTMWLRLRGRPDVSFVSMPSPLFQAFAGIVLRWRTGTPCVYWVQDIWPESATFTLGIRSRIAVAVLNAVCGWLYRRADIVLVQSAAFTGMITRFGVPRERIRVLPNTAPPLYRPVAPEEAPEHAALIPQDGFRLMFAGNIGESQDFDTLVAAAALLRDRPGLCWVIVGSGRDEARVRRLVAEKGLDARFRFLGRFPEAAMPGLFAHADAMLVSLKDTPIFALTVPYKTQCYMACGKPIVASLNGEGARIVAEAEAGVAVPAGRPEALAAAIAGLMDGPRQRRETYARNARRYFEENYAADRIHGDLERALADAAGMS
ncbi:glycosyltransferase family 4 protein [Shinella pollutisoli]|uniref:Glycosyltransferase family 4 protein n=1 Tax=Shinella pollutisoli TaxID=2250594 RepID=A0ABV7DFI0_9HYPH|nr:glycosyltransferase family 4 protein [Shinella pollutisoli]